MKIYLPENFNKIQFDEKYEKQLDQIKWFIHTLYVAPYTNHKYRKNCDLGKTALKKIGKPISGKYLVKLFGSRLYKDIIDMLIATKVIKKNDYYIVGKQPYKYALTKEFRNQKFKTCKIEYTPVVNKKSKSNLEILSMDTKQAKELIDREYKAELEELKHKRIARELAVAMWQDKNFFEDIDPKSGRKYNNLTNLPKEFRKCLNYDGEPLVSIDISNSQPYFFVLKLLDAYKLNPNCYNNSNPYIKFDTNKLINSIINNSKNKPSPHTHTYDFPFLEFLKQLPVDFQYYIDLVITGTLYEILLEVVNQLQITKKTYTRDEIKKQLLTIFYQKESEYNSNLKNVFITVFPNIYKVITEAKKHNYADLAIDMQKLEADLIVKTVWERLQLENIPAWTIHDSVMTTPSNVEYVETVILEEAIKKYKIAPSLKIEK